MGILSREEFEHRPPCLRYKTASVPLGMNSHYAKNYFMNTGIYTSKGRVTLDFYVSCTLTP